MFPRLILTLLLLLSAAACNLTTEAVVPTATNSPATRTNTPQPTPSHTATLNPTATERPIVTVLPDCTPRSDWTNSYTVQPGDTLFRIAQRANTTVDTLARGNCLDDPGRIATGLMLFSPNPVLTPTPEVGTQDLFMYLIAEGDAGNSGIPVGCDDSAVLQATGFSSTGSLSEDLRIVLNTMLNVQGSSNIVNAFASMDLNVASISITNGTATIDLNGELMLIGVCKDAQIEAQMLLNVFQFESIQNALIRVGGRNFKQALDQSGASGPNSVYNRNEAPQGPE